MGTGGTLPIESPENLKYLKFNDSKIEYSNKSIIQDNNQKNDYRLIVLLANKFYGQALGQLVLVN